MVPPLADHTTAVLVLPLTVAVNCCVPPVSSETDCGEMATATVDESAVGELIVKLREFDIVPVLWFSTETVAIPADAMSLEEMAAVSWVLLSTVVARAWPFHSTTHFLLKDDPVTLRVNPLLPATALDGDRPLITSMGLHTAGITRITRQYGR